MKQDEFLFSNTTASLNSANLIFNELWDYFKDSKSFIDIGCGLGGWSAALEKRGLLDFRSYDHPSLPKEDLLIKNKHNFIPIDLEESIPPSRKVDFGVCIEVLEHFDSNQGLELIEYLSSCTDLILFSAAVPCQSGIGHINEQRHSYWHKIFAKHGYNYFDGFKPQLYKYEDQIKFYHIQNLFIYYKGIQVDKFAGKKNITSPRFEIVATDILEKQLDLSDLVREIPSSIIRSLKFRIKKF